MNPTEEVQSRIAPLLAPLLAPLPGDRRAGVDARNDPRAELLRDEMRKDEYLRRDWPAISDAAGGLLAEVTRDFVVASCWASAAYETEGLSGLVAGLSLLQGLLAQYWEDMFPPSAKHVQRFNALGNFYEHIGTRLQAVGTDPSKDTGARPLGVVTPDDAPWLAACSAALAALHETAQTRFEPPPKPHLVRDQIARLTAALPKPKPPPAPARTATAPRTPVIDPGSPGTRPPAARDAGASGSAADVPDRSATAAARHVTAASPSGAPDPDAAAPQIPAASLSGASNPAAAPRIPPDRPSDSPGADAEFPSVHAASTSGAPDPAVVASHVPAVSPSSAADPAVVASRVPAVSPSSAADPAVVASRVPAASPSGASSPAAVLSSVSLAGATVDTATASLLTEGPVNAVTPDAWAIPAGSEPLEAPPRPPPNAAEVPAYLNAISPNLVRAAHALRRHQPGDPLAYRLLRVAVWLRAAEPAPDARGRVPVDALLPATRTPCEAMLRSGKWLELLDASESALAAPTNRFCLDLHRYTASALTALGHHAAHTAVLAELAGLLRRMPGLVDLCARDGTPLADRETRALLASLAAAPVPSAQSSATSGSGAPALSSATSAALPGSGAASQSSVTVPVALSGYVSPTLSSSTSAAPGSGASSLSSAALTRHPSGAPDPATPLAHVAPPLAWAEQGPTPASLDAALTAARARLSARDVQGALALMRRLAETAASPRDRFTARVDLACLTLEAGLVPVARAQLAALLREADERRLSEWEPQLVVRLLDALLTALRHGPTSPDTQPLFERLCTLDPVTAASHHAPVSS